MLGTDNCVAVRLGSFLHDLKQDFDFALICVHVQEKGVGDQQTSFHQLPDFLPVLVMRFGFAVRYWFIPVR